MSPFQYISDLGALKRNERRGVTPGGHRYLFFPSKLADNMCIFALCMAICASVGFCILLCSLQRSKRAAAREAKAEMNVKLEAVEAGAPGGQSKWELNGNNGPTALLMKQDQGQVVPLTRKQMDGPFPSSTLEKPVQAKIVQPNPHPYASLAMHNQSVSPGFDSPRSDHTFGTFGSVGPVQTPPQAHLATAPQTSPGYPAVPGLASRRSGLRHSLGQQGSQPSLSTEEEADPEEAIKARQETRRQLEMLSQRHLHRTSRRRTLASTDRLTASTGMSGTPLSALDESSVAIYSPSQKTTDFGKDTSPVLAHPPPRRQSLPARVMSRRASEKAVYDRANDEYAALRQHPAPFSGQLPDSPDMDPPSPRSLPASDSPSTPLTPSSPLVIVGDERAPPSPLAARSTNAGASASTQAMSRIKPSAYPSPSAANTYASPTAGYTSTVPGPPSARSSRQAIAISQAQGPYPYGSHLRTPNWSQTALNSDTAAPSHLSSSTMSSAFELAGRASISRSSSGTIPVGLGLGDPSRSTLQLVRSIDFGRPASEHPEAEQVDSAHSEAVQAIQPADEVSSEGSKSSGDEEEDGDDTAQSSAYSTARSASITSSISTVSMASTAATAREAVPVRATLVSTSSLRHTADLSESQAVFGVAT